MDELIILDSDVSNLKAKSFQFKTRVPQIFNSPVLYLDSDTLPIRPFWKGFHDGNWDIALIQDRSEYCPMDPVYPHWVEEANGAVETE